MSIEIVLLTLLGIYLIWTTYEIISIHRFNLNFFYNGIRIYRKVIKCSFSNWENFDGIYRQEEAKYVFIPDLKTGYFVTRFYYFRTYSFFVRWRGIPLTIYGMFVERNNELNITYRISYRIGFLIAIWIIGWLIIPILTGKLIIIGIGLTVILVTLGIIYIRYIFLEGKMLIISDEISDMLKMK